MSGLRVLAATAIYPSAEDPARGAFVAAQIRSLERAGVKIERLVFPPRGGVRGYTRAAREIARVARAWRADLVHAHYGLVGWSAVWQAVPVVTSFCGDDLQGTVAPDGGLTLRSRVGMALSQQAAHRSAGIVCKSERLRDRLLSRGARARAVIEPNGVDTDRFCPGDRLAAREALGLARDARIVLFPNSPNEPNKRLDLARAALERVRRRVPRAELVVGSGIAHERMPFFFRAADLTLLTSDREGSPNVVKESIATGTPVVSTDVGDVRRWIGPSCGRIVASDAESIAAAVEDVLEHPPCVDASIVRREISSDAVARRSARAFNMM